MTATTAQVFVGVMGPWQVTPTTVEVALRDASYYLERQVPRNETCVVTSGGMMDGSALVLARG